MARFIFCFFLLISFSLLEGFEATLEPDAALKKLLAGNDRFARDQLTCPERTQERRLALVSKQNPFAVIVACSDSRVSPDLVFDQGVGDLFVVRDAGNIIGETELDSIEYAVLHLHAGLIVVLGHANCGAVSAVLSGHTGDIETVASLIGPFIKEIKPGEPDALEKAVKANVRGSVQTIRKSSQLKTLLEQKKLAVVGGYYNLESGRVELLKD